MKPETAAFFRKSRDFLAKAQDMLDAHHYPDEAGRAAYLAGFHAAQAFLFESTAKVFKSPGFAFESNSLGELWQSGGYKIGIRCRLPPQNP